MLRVCDFSKAGEQSLLKVCRPILSDPMAVQWVEAADSPNSLNDRVVGLGWSNQTAIACKAAWHLRTRFPDMWNREKQAANSHPSRRFVFEPSDDLPDGFEMDVATVLNGERAASDEPLLLRELRGPIVVGGEPIMVNSYDLEGQFDPQRSNVRMTDRFFGRDFPNGPHFGLCQKDDHMEFGIIDVGSQLVPHDHLVIHTRPIFYRPDSNKILRHGKSLTLWHYYDVEGFWLSERLHIILYKDYGSHADRAKCHQGEARYYRKYFRIRRGHYLDVQFYLDKDWRLIPSVNDAEAAFSLNGDPEPETAYVEWHARDHEEAFAKILMAHGSRSLHDICGPWIMNNPSVRILDLLTNQ